MSVIPSKQVEQVQFCESHWPVWNTQLGAVGLASPQVQSFKTLTLAARAAYDAAQAAKQAAKLKESESDPDHLLD